MNKDEYKQLYEQVCEQYDVLAKEFEAIKQALAAPTVQEPVATLFGSLPVYDTTPPAQPAVTEVQEPVAWARYPRYTGPIQKAEIVFTKPEGKDWLELYTTPPAAQPAVPDAMTSADIQESIEYVAGWNDCRAEMLKGLKP
jgi:hypothetical protein